VQVSHRFKRSKPLKSSKKNTKSDVEESPMQFPTAQNSAETDAIYDFLYVDRAKISALYAQIVPHGVLTSLKTSAQTNFSSESDIGGDIKVFKAGTKVTDGGSEGIEHMFDTSWSIPLPLEVIDCLRTRKIVHDSHKNAALGAFSAMPNAIHAHFLTAEALLPGSLQPNGLLIPTVDLTLKYGGTVSGKWNVLYSLDTWADKGEPPDTSLWSGGELMNAVLSVIHGMRTIIGRPSGWHGVTPLMIYRPISIDILS